MLSDTHIGEWGFSAIIEADGERILFDTGSRENTVLLNAEELNIDLGGIKDVFLSHNHSDHTGGLISLKKLATFRPPLKNASFPGRNNQPALS